MWRMFCPSRGAEAKAGARFCPSCGAALAAAAVSAPPVVEAAQPPSLPRGGGRLWLLIGGVGAAILAVVVVVALVAGGGDSEAPSLGSPDPTAEPGEPTATPSPTTEPTPELPRVVLDPSRARDFARAILIAPGDLPGGGFTITFEDEFDDEPFGLPECTALDDYGRRKRAFDADTLAGEANRTLSRGPELLDKEVDVGVEVYRSDMRLAEFLEELRALIEDGSYQTCLAAFVNADSSTAVGLESVEPSTVVPNSGVVWAGVYAVPVEGNTLFLRVEQYSWIVGNVRVSVTVYGGIDEFSDFGQATIAAVERSLESVIADPEAALAEPEEPETGATERWAQGYCEATESYLVAIDIIDVSDLDAAEDVEDVKRLLRALWLELLDATAEWGAALGALPVPGIEDGPAFQAVLSDAVADLEGFLRQFLDEIEGLDSDDPEAFVAALDRLNRDFELAADGVALAVGHAGRTLDVSALSEAVEAVPGCTAAGLLVDAEPATPTEGDDPDGDSIVGAADRCPTEPETENGVFDGDGCPDTFDDLVVSTRSLLDGFWNERLDEEDLEYRTAEEFVAYTSAIDTPCGEAELGNAFYCRASHGVYYDQNLMLAQLQQNGDFAPVFVLAHEWGHLVQGLLGTLDEFPPIVTELQADCMAGMFAAHVGRLGLLEAGDLEEAAGALFLFGDRDVPAFDPDAHGTPGQRIDAFDRGLRGLGCTPSNIGELVP